MGNLDWIMKEATKRLPLYKRSVEVCCGRGELIWHTKAPKEEYFNDKDPNIIRIHKFAQNITLKELSEFQKSYNWVLTKKHYKHILKEFEVKDDFDFAYRFLYILGGGIQGTSSKYFFRPRTDLYLNSAKRIKDIRLRLQNVRFTNLDAIDCIKRFDSEDNFFFIDPPYPSREGYYAVSDLNWVELRDLLSKIRSKWMMVYDPHVVPKYKGIRKKNIPYVKRCADVAKQLIDEYSHISLRSPLSFQQQFKTWKFLRNYKEYFIVCNYDILEYKKPEDLPLSW